MNEAADVVIIGGGPAGAAAGIHALARGLRPVLFERRPFPRDRPGETLHPGVAPLLRQLGVLESVTAMSPVRPEAQWTAWRGPAELVPYGSDQRGTWRAFQVLRRDLDRLLIDRFRALGGEVVQPSPRVAPIIESGRANGVRGWGAVVRAPITIDASGAAGFMRRALRIASARHSPRLVARFGHRRGKMTEAPSLIGDAGGWTWTAQVQPDLVSWTRLDFDPSQAGSFLPADLLRLPEVGRTGAADVTWRQASRFAGPGYFLAGEAAMVLDPAAGHGVLRAMMSGMMAAHCAADLIQGTVSEDRAASAYGRWVGSWFQRDAAAMRKLYARLGVDWPLVIEDNP